MWSSLTGWKQQLGSPPHRVQLARWHGTRNPGSKDKQKMETLLPKLRDKIVAAWGAGESGFQSEQVEALGEWRWSKGEEKDDILISRGHLEH